MNQKVLDSMKHLSEFHDGWFQGILIDEKRSHLFLATERKECFVMVADGTEALAVDGVKSGNIIFEVLTRGHEEILPADIDVLYELPSTSAGKQHREAVIANAHRQKLSLLEMNPSYGAKCLVLASSIRLFSYDEWLKEYGTFFLRDMGESGPVKGKVK